MRHRPEIIGISLDEHGWANVAELIEGVSRTRFLDMVLLEEIVRTLPPKPENEDDETDGLHEIDEYMVQYLRYLYSGRHYKGNYAITYVNGSITITSTVPDCDGVVDYGDYSYETIQIGTQCWLTENLRIAEDAAGNEIGTPLFDDEANVGKFGLLYTWYEAMGVEEGETPAAAGFVQGICPEGWHIPSHADMMALKSVVDGNVQYLRDKDPMQQYWIESARGVDPNYGFQSRGSGCYNSTSGHFEEYMLREHYWESVSDPNSDLVEVAGVTYFCDEIMLESSSRNDKRSVRCLRDE